MIKVRIIDFFIARQANAITKPIDLSSELVDCVFEISSPTTLTLEDVDELFYLVIGSRVAQILEEVISTLGLLTPVLVVWFSTHSCGMARDDHSVRNLISTA